MIVLRRDSCAKISEPDIRSIRQLSFAALSLGAIGPTFDVKERRRRRHCEYRK